MLVKLQKKDIIQHWDLLEQSFSHAPNAEELKENIHFIMEQFLIGNIHAWITIRDDDIIMFVITSFIYDPIASGKSLLLYYVNAVQEPEPIDWAEGIVTLKRYAKNEDCNQIIAYSQFESVIKKAEMLGADSNMRMLTFKVE